MAEPIISKLRNPLDAFTTYSTHFIVMAARSTETARAFVNPKNNRQTLDAIDRVDALGEAIPFTTAANTTGDVFLAIDTRRFSQFTVESMKYEVLINGLSAGQSHSNLATIIDMTVLDSVGISFINFIQWLMDSKLQTNFDGMIFLIKVLFVGHKEDGTTETIHGATIPAYLFNMEVNLDYSKGVYTLQFMPNMNFSVFQHNRWLHIGSASSFKTIGSKTLQSVVSAFEDRLNVESKSFYDSTNPIMLAAGRGAINTQSGGKFGRLVKYQITLPEGWGEKEFFGSWKYNVNQSEERNFVQELQKLDTAKTPAQQRSSSPADSAKSPGKDASVSTPVGITITEVLDIIFKQVPAIAEFANSEKTKNPDGLLKFYKHIVSLTSTDDTVTVHVDVVAFEVPNVKPPSKTASEAVSQHQDKFYRQIVEDGQRKNVPANFFELDYIFTGKNTQILNFDMKIQNLQFMLASNTKVSAGELVHQSIQTQSEESKVEKTKLPEVLANMRPYDPFLIPMKTEIEKSAFEALSANARDKNSNSEVSSNLQQYSRNLSSFYAISPIQLAMTIKGNPDIMMKFSSSDIPPHSEPVSTTGSAGQISSREEYRREFERRILEQDTDTNTVSRTAGGTFLLNPQLGQSSYMTTPVFVKVNIFGPNVDFRTNQLVNGEDFAKAVLYDNYYVVFKVTNVIERGVFTQELELWSHNVFGVNKISKEQVDARKTIGTSQ